MNSIHDLGGMDGMGPLPFEPNEPLFHEEWERTAFGVNMLLLMAGVFSADEHRHSMERIQALHWLASPYYLHWVDGDARLLLEKGIATLEELATGKSANPLPDWASALKAVPVEAVLATCSTNFPVSREPTTPPKFRIGDRVRALNINPKAHTRLPRYVRGRIGTIMSQPGCFLYADSRAKGVDDAKNTYSVRFEAADLWGPDSVSKDAVYIDLYETYIEAA